ncbi:MAG: hypothetical protein ACLP1Q_01755 [Solirubrobacteraceae bacterium]|jgi:hypothetical protein
MMRSSSGVYLSARPPIYGPPSIFRDDATLLARSSSQVFKEKLANQCFYNRASQTGHFFGYEGLGYGGVSEDFNVFLNWKSFTTAVYYVRPNVPRVKVWCVQQNVGTEETLQEPGAHDDLQGSLESVPIPNPALIPHGQIQPAGTDRDVVILCPATGEMWEFWRFGQFLKGTHLGEYKCAFGGYTNSIAGFDGVWPNEWGLSASSLGILGGVITMADLVRLLRGDPLGHALGIAVLVTANEHLAPATRNDHKENTFEFLEDGVTPNPAFGAIDAVPEGLWCAFPAASRASEHGITGPIASKLYEAAREHGIVVHDGAGNPAFDLADPRQLGTPYSDTLVNPFAGATYLEEKGTRESYINSLVPEGWTDPTLPVITENLNGATGLFSKFPWRDLEQLEPRAS